MPTAARVLVLDCWTRKALSVVRSLGRDGMTVDTASHDMHAAPMYSRFVRKRFHFVNPSRDGKRYTEQVLSCLRTGNYDCVLPLEDASMSALAPVRASIAELAALPMPDDTALAIASDKWRTYEQAKNLGIPAPLSLPVASVRDAIDASASLGFPMIVKPRRSSGSRGLARVQSKEDVETFFQRHGHYHEFIAQEALPIAGAGVGVAVLAVSGQVGLDFSYRRLREFPVNGGPSTLRESTDAADLKGYAKQMIERLGWNGVAMFEFKIDLRDGIAKLLEINPRFWGSLELANAAGINFPAALIRATLGEPISTTDYKVGVRCRWLIPGDIAHFIANPARFNLKPSFFDFFDRNTKYDEFASDDVRGSIASVACAGLSLFNAETWRIGVFRK